MGSLIAAAIKISPWAEMTLVSIAVITRRNGVEGNYKNFKDVLKMRQVTILTESSWDDTCKEIGIHLPWETRRANLYVTDITFGPKDMGKTLQVGSALLEITGPTTPCKRMDQAHPGLRQALMPEWRGGVTCRVLTGGSAGTGSPVNFV